MGIINPIKKWDKDKNVWREPNGAYELGRCFAFGVYEDVINDKNSDDFHYIILAGGSRVEDHTKNSSHISDIQVSVDKVIKYFKTNGKRNYRVMLFLMDADAPIKEDSRLMASLFDKYSSNDSVKSINYIGISKCGTMGFYIPQYFNKEESFSKTNIFNIAAPYLGTKMASPKFIYPLIKDYIVKMFGDNKFSEVVYRKAIGIYEGISSNSHMDYDISVIDGVFDSQVDSYDKSFISEMFSEKNIFGMNRVNSFTNFVTGIDENTLNEALRTFNITGIALCVLNRFIMDGNSDGMVPVSSQVSVNEVCDVALVDLKSSHHAVMTMPRVVNTIMSKIDERIEIDLDKRYLKV